MANKNITYKTQSLIYVLIIFGFIVVINYLASKKFFRLDLTESKMYSISDASKKLLTDLDDIINIKVYFSKNLPPHLKKIEADVKDVITEFKAYAGKNLHVSWEDPSENEETKRKVQSLGIPEIQMQTFEKDKAQVINGFLGLAVLYADKKEAMPVIQDMTNFEYDLAQNIMKVFRKEIPKIAILKTDTMPYFDDNMRMQMRGQLPPDKTEEKYKPMFEELKKNYEVKTVDISEGTPIDAEYRTLIVPGGDDNSFTERDLFEIDQYFMKGGNLIILADAIDISLERGVNARIQSPLILNLLEHYGVKVEKSIVLDASCGQVQIPQQVGPFRMNVPVNYPYITKVIESGFNKNNPAVSGLAQMIMPWASPLSILIEEGDSTDSGSESKVKATPLVHSSSNSWVESGGRFNLNPQQNWQAIFNSKADQLKEHILAVSLNGDFSSYFEGKSIPPVKSASDTGAMNEIKLSEEDKNRETVSSNIKRNLIVTGDSDFLTSESAAPGNIAFLLNIVDWISLDENLISIRSRALVDRTIKNDKLEEGKTYATTIRFLNILAMPILVIIIGLIIFFKRREVIVHSPAQEKK
ncbi:MAG: GldG family protein [Chitinispirillia bacterium]|jgi:gliding-associated putative ABC transporter substrate-binding component GldG